MGTGEVSTVELETGTVTGDDWGLSQAAVVSEDAAVTAVKFEEAVVAEPLLRTIRELWVLFELKLNTSSEPDISTEPKRLFLT